MLGAHLALINAVEQVGEVMLRVHRLTALVERLDGSCATRRGWNISS